MTQCCAPAASCTPTSLRARLHTTAEKLKVPLAPTGSRQKTNVTSPHFWTKTFTCLNSRWGRRKSRSLLFSSLGSNKQSKELLFRGGGELFCLGSFPKAQREKRKRKPPGSSWLSANPGEEARRWQACICAVTSHRSHNVSLRSVAAAEKQALMFLDAPRSAVAATLLATKWADAAVS